MSLVNQDFDAIKVLEDIQRKSSKETRTTFQIKVPREMWDYVVEHYGSIKHKDGRNPSGVARALILYAIKQNPSIEELYPDLDEEAQ